MRIDIIPHWKLFDIIEFPDNQGFEISILFFKALLMKERNSYYFDNIGLGVDILRTNRYTSIVIRLIAFSIDFSKKKNRHLEVVK